MSFVYRCANCDRLTPVKISGTVKDAESVGERIVRLATEPVNPYHNWCVDCILDSPKI